MEVTLKATLSPEDMNALAQKVAVINAKEKVVDKPESIKEFFTVNEVAEKTKRTSWTIRQHISAGLLNAEKIGKSWLISKESFNKYTKNGE